MKTLALLLTVLFPVLYTTSSSDEVFESLQAAEDPQLSTDPAADFWQGAKPIYAEKGKHGEDLKPYRTEIRSRWTRQNLYLLFACPYESLNLKPAPDTASETNRLWNWDVAEAFIGSDFKHIERYKEFEVSPQGEWVDLDIDLSNPHHEEGWTWNSGMDVAARIDKSSKTWYGAMRIPFAALSSQAPAVGTTFRINLFRSQGPPPRPVHIVWRPSMSETFHVPQQFGVLRLVAK